MSAMRAKKGEEKEKISVVEKIQCLFLVFFHEQLRKGQRRQRAAEHASLRGVRRAPSSSESRKDRSDRVDTLTPCSLFLLAAARDHLVCEQLWTTERRYISLSSLGFAQKVVAP